MTQILKSGPPGLKKNIAALGDGFAGGDQTLYTNKMKELLIEGIPPAGGSNDQDVGLFKGASYNDSGIYRVVNCRMRGNVPPYCQLLAMDFPKKAMTKGSSILRIPEEDMH